MVSPNKVLIAIFCLMASFTSFQAANHILPINNSDATPEISNICDLPAPENYRITEIGTDMMVVAWELPAILPMEYLIQVFETQTGNLVQNFNISGHLTTATASGLQPGTEYTINCIPICSDNIHSRNFGYISGMTWILDLVVNGFAAPAEPISGFLSSSNFKLPADPLEEHIVIFKICPVGNEAGGRFFGLYEIKGTCSPDKKVFKILEDPTSKYIITCPPPYNKLRITQKTLSPPHFILLAEISVVEVIAGEQQVVSSPVYNGFQILCYGPSYGVPDNNCINCEGQPTECLGPNIAPEADDRQDNQFETNQSFAVFPNPFQDQVEIQFANNMNNEDRTIRLYNPHGQLVKTFDTPGTEQSMLLTLTDLAAGIYFLQVHSGGHVQTVKMVKAR